MKFEFATASRILFGPGTVRNIARPAADMGRKVLLLTGRNPERSSDLIRDLESCGMEIHLRQIKGEPSTDMVTAGADFARKCGCDMVISMGGGSVVDAGKAVAALLTNTGKLSDYLEVIGKGRPIEREPAPFIAVPTTAGTGAEVTRNAVLESPEHRVKVSMRGHLMLPRLAVADPELTYSLPPDITAASGLDALTQLIEAFVSKDANPLTDGLCREGISRAGRSLVTAYENGADKNAREDMCLASLFSGLALANAKLGAVHGMAAPIGGMFSVPHGKVCAALLPHAVAANIRALAERMPESSSLGRYAEIGKILTGSPEAEAEDTVSHLRHICRLLHVRPLRESGVREEDIPAIIPKAQKAGSMKGNPLALSDGELRDILIRAIQGEEK